MMKLYPSQKKYAAAVLRQMKDNGVALLQLPTGQGKTIVALKVAAELLSHSRKGRPLILVTRRRQPVDEFIAALRGDLSQDISNSPWIRDAAKCGGLRGLVRGKSPNFSEVQCWSAKDLLHRVPIGALVIIDEVHRFQSFLQRQAREAHLDRGGRRPTPAKRRQFLLLSATPINPARIASEICHEERSLQDQIGAEDDLIRNSFLDLYRAMINLSFLSRAMKDELLRHLTTKSGQSLEEFADDLRSVMDVLQPVPEPSELRQLGPKEKNLFERTARIAPCSYGKSVLGMMGLQMAIMKDENVFYCTERMAMAGGVARTASTVGVRPQPTFSHREGIFHHQPSIQYTQETVASLRSLDRNGGLIRRRLTSDRSSESINLHRHCDIMIHFDLDWSPLRMIQRYGRLWRIDSHSGVRNLARQIRPRPPAVFHLVQPGSVDEEILWRLERRWHQLQRLKLGLDQVTFHHALGTRIYGVRAGRRKRGRPRKSCGR